MSSVAYVNGRYGPIADAAVSIDDRGFQFADSVYEVVAFLNGALLDWSKHLWRLRRSLAALFITGAPSDAALLSIAERLMRQSRYADGLLYIQISRGVARRDHGFPSAAKPTLVMTARRFDFTTRIGQLETGISLMSLPDQRWARCDIKTTGLLPAVLAKQEARRNGAFEAIFEADGEVRKGSSTNVYIVDGAGGIITHPLSQHILAGVARDSLLDIARRNGIAIAERAFTLTEAYAAPEMFITSTTVPILPVVRLDGKPIGQGQPGTVVQRLAGLVWEEIRQQTGWRGDKPVGSAGSATAQAVRQ